MQQPTMTSQSNTTAAKNIKKWEVFPGRNRFCCDGRLMLSSQTGIFYFTIFLIVATSACFFGMDAWYLWTYVSPVLPILAGVQCVFVICVLCRTAFGDPGVLPRATPGEAAELEKLIEEGNNSAGSPNGTYLVNKAPRIKEVTINGQSFKLKYCYTCKIFRPPRASHCSVCDNCVDRFDHHCPWVGNCVGRRNYKYFYMFLLSLTIYCAYLMAVSVTAIVERSKASSFADAMSSAPLSPVVVLVAFFSIWSVAGLAGFHTHLICQNVTTNEDIKGTFNDKAQHTNPFSKGSCHSNCALILCGPLPPSLIDRRGWITSDDIPNASSSKLGGSQPSNPGSSSGASVTSATRETPRRGAEQTESKLLSPGSTVSGVGASITTNSTTKGASLAVAGQKPVRLTPLEHAPAAPKFEKETKNLRPAKENLT